MELESMFAFLSVVRLEVVHVIVHTAVSSRTADRLKMAVDQTDEVGQWGSLVVEYGNKYGHVILPRQQTCCPVCVVFVYVCENVQEGIAQGRLSPAHSVLEVFVRRCTCHSL